MVTMPDATVQTSFQLDPGTAKAIEELKGAFGVSSNTAVIRKAVALARIAANNRNDDEGTVTLVDKEGARLKVSLTG
jgi:hypothetical protein